jgi:signal transduction histidine kinase
LIGGLSVDGTGQPVVEYRPGDDRFAEAGSGTYWQVATDRGDVRSDSLWDQRLPRPSKPSGTEWQVEHLRSPFGGTLLMVQRYVRPAPRGRGVLVQVATNDAELRGEHREFLYETATSLIILWLFLNGAAFVQVTLGLRPLTAIGRQIGHLRSNAAARIGAVDVPEITPLTDAINDLAETRQADLERARRRAGDLAHSLKTPLAALSAQSRRARQAGATEAADGLDRAIASMRATLETELARSRAAAAREGAESGAPDIEKLLEGLIAVIERTDYGENRLFETDIPDRLRLPIASEDLTELLGAVIENGARHARFHVRISGHVSNESHEISIEDDGPGIADEGLEGALVRGGRLDEAGPGHGFGLAIVHDLVRATGGNIDLGRSPLGGLKVRLSWPQPDRPEQTRDRRRWAILTQN